MIVVVDLPNNQETRTRFININVILLYIIVAYEECKEMRSPHLPTWGGNEDFFLSLHSDALLGVSMALENSASALTWKDSDLLF
jgi:hypothetical protein